MKGFLSRRPSASMVVAMLALVVATSGTAIAAGSLTSGDSLIKKATLSGNRLRNHTITGTQVNLNKLGKVPSAKKADSATSASKATTATSATSATNATNAVNATNATNAGNAATVGGRSVTTFSVLSATGAAAPTTVFNFGGLVVQLLCDSSGDPNVTATGSVSGALIRGTGIGTGVASPFAVGSSNTTAGTAETLWSSSDALGTLTFQYATPTGHDVSVTAMIDDHDTINGFDGCSMNGSAISGG